MNASLSTPNHSQPLTERLADGFAERLAPHFVLERLEAHPASIFGLLPDGVLAYVNPAWVAFARENGSSTIDVISSWIGHRYLDVIAAPLRPFYAKLFERAPDVGSALQPLSHVYECSSAETFRQFAMKVYALANGGGFIVINTLVSSRPHDITHRLPKPPERSLYESAGGLILQCAHCRLIRRADKSGWDWVPEWIEKMPDGTSHGVCEVCLEYYYPDSD